MTANDLDLLRQFTHDHSQDAFTALVRRHVNLVYSAALRQVRSPQLAEEIAQSVFADLARDAGKLKPDTILTAWLYQVARRTAIDAVRKESRRQLREQIAMEMNAMNATANDWTQIEPLLDDAMAALDETDRSAILLRYFENKNLREVGASLKISDDAAQKRVSRAVEKLREFFSKQKITIGASGLVVLISANAIQAAPVGLALTIANASLAAGTTLTFMKITTATKLKFAFNAIIVAAAVTAFVTQHLSQNKLRDENKALRQQIAQLQTDSASFSNRMTEIGEAKNLSAAQFSELLKLRGEIGILRRQLVESAQENRKLQNVGVQMRSLNTNSFVPQIHIKARFIAMPKETSYDFKMAGDQTSIEGFSGILNDASFRNILHELESHDDVETLAEPEVVTASGRQTQMRATQTINVVTKFMLQESNHVSSIIPQTEPVETGPILDVTPRVLSDGYTIELLMIPSVTEFLGYASSTKTTPAYTANGQEIDVPTASPQFQMQGTTNTVNLLDNQTVVLAAKRTASSGQRYTGRCHISAIGRQSDKIPRSENTGIYHCNHPRSGRQSGSQRRRQLYEYFAVNWWPINFHALCIFMVKPSPRCRGGNVRRRNEFSQRRHRLGGRLQIFSKRSHAERHRRGIFVEPSVQNQKLRRSDIFRTMPLLRSFNQIVS